MGFTRSTTDISVHQELSDYPNQDDGLSAEQLKERFDFPAETLQDDINGLMGELESVTSAENLGADVITFGDESAPNVQAKLNKIYEDMQAITQGTVADGSITASKLASSLSNTIGFKDGTLQTGLNAEKLGGSTLAQIQAFVTGGTVEGTYTGNTTAWSSGVQSINLGFKPKLLVIQGTYYPNISGETYRPNSIIIFLGLCNKGITTNLSGNTYTIDSSKLEATSTGFTVKGSSINYSSNTYYYVAIR